MHFADAFAATHREQPIRYATKAEMHAAVFNHPVEGDKLPSLVYADHLEENGSPNVAAFIREAAERGEVGKPGAGRIFGHIPTNADHVRISPDADGGKATRIHLSVGVPHSSNPEWASTTVHRMDVPHKEAVQWLRRLGEDGVYFVDDELKYLRLVRPYAFEDEEQPVQHRRDGDPLIRRKLNLKHQKSRAERNRKLTPAELAAKIRESVSKSPRTLSKVQSSLRLDRETTAAAISEGERSGLLKTVPTARGRRVEPHSGPSPHTTSSAEKPVSDAATHFAREFARHFAAYRAPEGGVSVKGLYYPGGQLVPDLTKFAAEPKVAEEVAMAPTGSYRVSQQFAPVRDAETQVIRPAGAPYRGSQQLQSLPPRPNGLRLIEPATPKPQPRLPSMRERVAASIPPKSPPAKPKPQPKDDGVPIRRRTAKPSLIDRLRKLIAANLQPARYARAPEGELAAWQKSIAEQPTDRVRRGAFADYLEENGYHHDDDTLATLRTHEGPVSLHEHPGSGEVIAHPQYTREELIAAYRDQMRDAYKAARPDQQRHADAQAETATRSFADDISSIHTGPNGVHVGVWHRGDDISRGGSVLKFDPKSRRFAYAVRSHFDPNEAARRASGSPRT